METPLKIGTTILKYCRKIFDFCTAGLHTMSGSDLRKRKFLKNSCPQITDKRSIPCSNLKVGSLIDKTHTILQRTNNFKTNQVSLVFRKNVS